MTDAKNLETLVNRAKERLDAHVRETVEWHFNPETGKSLLARKGQKLLLRPT